MSQPNHYRHTLTAAARIDDLATGTNLSSFFPYPKRSDEIQLLSLSRYDGDSRDRASSTRPAVELPWAKHSRLSYLFCHVAAGGSLIWWLSRDKNPNNDTTRKREAE